MQNCYSKIYIVCYWRWYTKQDRVQCNYNSIDVKVTGPNIPCCLWLFTDYLVAGQIIFNLKDFIDKRCKVQE